MDTTEYSIDISKDARIHATISARNTTKPTLVFLHFWGGSSRTWSKVIPLLSSDEYHTVAIDFRGWGSSTGPSDPAAYNIGVLASDVETVLHESGITEYVLIGHSMGGKVAQLVAGQKKIPGLKGLILVAPAPPSPLVLPEEARHQQEHAYESAESAEFVTRNVLTATQLSKADVSMIVQDMTRGSVEAKAAWPAYGMGEDLRDVARKIDVPVLVVGAAKDQVETIEKLKNQVLSEIKGSRLEIIPDCGHLVPVEAPRILVEHIKPFLEEISVGKRTV
jgi:3-oxoadipate enol-lactonase